MAIIWSALSTRIGNCSQISNGEPETVARTTLERAAEIGLEATLLPEWYDIDDLETLGWLRDELAGRSTRYRNGSPAMATRAFLAAMPGASR